MAIDEFDKGSGTYGIPATGVANGPTDESGVCVAASEGMWTQQAPLTIL